MDPQKLYETLKKSQEPKGYYFNYNTNLVFELLQNLIAIKDQIGYMACPCRLNSGDKENDKDIICPCQYREEDVKEFGTCYCGLYVSKENYENKIAHTYIPDRRHPEKILL